MAQVKFYRGLKANYSPEITHLNGLYYATDTHEVLMNGVSYGNVKDLKLQKRSGTEGSYEWANATTLYWGGHYRFATSDGVLAFEFDTPSAKSDGYLTFDSNGTNLDINSAKIADAGSATGHDKLATKGYVDDQITGLNNAIVRVAGNDTTTASGDTLTLAKGNEASQIYSGDLTFTEKDGGTQIIKVKFDAADFVKDSYLKKVTYYQTTGDVPSTITPTTGTVFPALYFEFETTGGASNFWVSLNNLVDNYTGSDTIDITNHVISAKVAANGGLQAVSNEGLAVKLEADGGIAFDGTNGGLEIKPKTNSGIEVTSDGVAVKTGAGLQTDANGVSVKLHQTGNTADSGLTATSADGLTVNTAGYVTKNNNNITLDTSKIEGYAASEATTGDNNLASKKYVDSQLTAGLEWIDVPTPQAGA